MTDIIQIQSELSTHLNEVIEQCNLTDEQRDTLDLLNTDQLCYDNYLEDQGVEGTNILSKAEFLQTAQIVYIITERVLKRSIGMEEFYFSWRNTNLQAVNQLSIIFNDPLDYRIKINPRRDEIRFKSQVPTPLQWKVLFMYYIQGIEHADIAESINSLRSAVYSNLQKGERRIFNGINKLRL